MGCRIRSLKYCAAGCALVGACLISLMFFILPDQRKFLKELQRHQYMFSGLRSAPFEPTPCYGATFPVFSEATKLIEEEVRPTCPFKPQLSILHSNGTLDIDAKGYEVKECFYREVMQRGSYGEHAVLSTRTRISSNKTAQIRSAVVEVECLHPSGKIMYSDVHIRLRQLQEVDLQGTQFVGNLPNILIFVLDSTSRLNALRKFPQTVKYLTNELGGVILDRYHAVGQTSFENVFTMLTGKALQDITILSNKSNSLSSYLNDIPVNFLWKNASSKGYSTYFMEDVTETDLFRHFNKGFRNPPTDFNFRSYFSVIRYLRKKGYFKKGCIGNQSTHLQLLKILQQFLEMSHSKPFFAFHFLKQLSQHSIKGPHNADRHFRDWFQEGSEKGLFKNTVIFLTANQGHTAGPFAITPQGYYEQRLPIMVAVLSGDLLQKHPQLMCTLQSNRHIVASHLDTYHTILKLLSGSWMSSNETGVKLKSFLQTAFFSRRTCHDASISEQFCGCERH